MSLLRKFHVMNMRINGFYGARASWWLSAKQYDEKYNTKHTASQKKWAYKNGFLPSVVERYGINPHELVEKGEIPVFEKYDPYIPQELLRRAYATDKLRSDEPEDKIRELFDEIK